MADNEDGLADADEELEEDIDESPDSEEQPDIDDGEMADLSSVADAINEAEREDSENDDDSEETDTQESKEGEEKEDLSPSSTEGRSVGRMYTKGVVKLSESLVSEFGDESSEPITEADVRDMELDDAFNEWMASNGRPDDMSSGEWVAVGTLVLVGGNVLAETDLATEALNEL